MVQVVVQMPEGVGEWGLVELQGRLETRDEVSFDNMHIGDLHLDKKGIPHLIVGHHLLTGKVTELEKPYAILKKRSGTISGGDDAVVESLSESNTNTSTEYEVMALISKKIIFKNRPKPIITRTAVKKP